MQGCYTRKLFVIACTTALMLATARLHADCEEVGYIATFEVKPGSEAVFEKAVVEAAAKVLEMEPGTIMYKPYHAEGSSYYMMERYRNLAAREQHAKAPEVLAMFPPLMATLASPIGVTPVSIVCAADK